MAYFTQDFTDFFSDLKNNNTSEWFKENKKRYEKSVKEPFYNFVEEVLVRVKDPDPEISMLPKDCIFRLNRDIRFSKDKTPYKTHMGTVIAPGGRKAKEMPGFYFQIDADDIQIYAGGYMMGTQDIKNLKNAIAANHSEFREIIDEPQFKEAFGDVRGEKIKRLPKEWKEFAETEPLMFNKQFYVGAVLPKDKITSDDLADIIFEHFLISMNFIFYLREKIK